MWNAFLSVPLQLPLPCELRFDYKLVIASGNDIVRWEGFPENRRVTIDLVNLINHPQCAPVPHADARAGTSPAPPCQPASFAVGTPPLLPTLASDPTFPLMAVWVDCDKFGVNTHRLFPLRDSLVPVPVPASSFRSYTQLPEANSDREFVGVAHLKRDLLRQLQLFEGWAARGEWAQFHGSHYDWWTFPIPFPSSYRRKYCIFYAERDALIADSEYIGAFRRAVELACLSWGWSLGLDGPVPRPSELQTWHGWDIRLRKIGQSLIILGQKDLFELVHRMVDHFRQDCSYTFDERVPNPEDEWPFEARGGFVPRTPPPPVLPSL